MRAVIQRVSRASVTVKGEVIAKIETGLLILLGIENEDAQEDFGREDLPAKNLWVKLLCLLAQFILT